MSEKFTNEHDRHMARAEAEQISRRDEAIASILRNKAKKDPSEELKAAVDEAVKTALASAERLHEIDDAKVERDLSGTKMNVADSQGNAPANAEVSGAGGVGVAASNSAGDTTKPATNADQAVAGTPATPPVPPTGSTAEADAAKAEAAKTTPKK